MSKRTYANAVLGNFNNMTLLPVNRSVNTSSPSTSSPIPDPGSQTYNQLIDNNSHPLYLHNNDQPGMVLISKKLIGSENYASWKRSLHIALSAKNKFIIC